MKHRCDIQISELDGYLELGMAKESLSLARHILKRRPLPVLDFVSAVEAILIQADKLKPVRALVESAYTSLKRKEQAAAASKMLHYYVSSEDWAKAAEFVPIRSNNAVTLLFSMWTWLNLKRLEKARPLHKKCLRQLKATEPGDELAISSLLEALGSYYALMGDWVLAERAWSFNQDYSTFAENAWDGLVKLHAYRGLLQANTTLNSAATVFSSDEDALMLPGNSAGRRAWVEKTFRRHAKHLARVIPVKEHWRFGR